MLVFHLKTKSSELYVAWAQNKDKSLSRIDWWWCVNDAPALKQADSVGIAMG